MILGGGPYSWVNASSLNCDGGWWEYPRKPDSFWESPLPVAHRRCLHSVWQYPAWESQRPWGSAHLLWWRFGWIAKEREGKAHLNPTNWALAGLFHNDFISQYEFLVEVTWAHPEAPGTTFAGAYHLKDHLGSPALMQPSLLIEGFLLFHFFFLEKVHRDTVCLPPGNSLLGGKLRENLYLPKEGWLWRVALSSILVKTYFKCFFLVFLFFFILPILTTLDSVEQRKETDNHITGGCENQDCPSVWQGTGHNSQDFTHVVKPRTFWLLQGKFLL